MTEEPTPRTLAAGRYTLHEELGSGGAAVVFRAWDTVLDVPRAIKILHPDRGSPGMRRRMFSEAKAMARLVHPNVLRIWDIGHDDGADFVVMDLATGTLSDRLTTEGPLPPVQALQYTIQILAALAAAHNAGIVHRDVKPQNVLLDDQGTALLADFGIALVADDHRGTRTGIAMGSVAFMPPEQRLDARSVGPQADIYSTGATLYALFTARNPVDLFTAKAGSSRFNGLTPEVIGLIRKATAHDTEERFPNARSMASVVLALLAEAGEEPLHPPSPNDAEYFPLPSERVSRSVGSGLTRPPPPPPAASIDASITYLTEIGDEPMVPPVGGTLVADDDYDDDSIQPGALPPAALPPPIPPPAESDAIFVDSLADEEAHRPLPMWVLAAAALLPLLLIGVGAVFFIGPGDAPDEGAGPDPVRLEGIAVSEPGSKPPEPEPVAPTEADPTDGGTEAAPVPAGPAPVPAPTAGPAPAKPAPAPASAPLPTGPAPLGVWRGSVNGKSATLTLGGSLEAIRGRLEVSYLGNSVPSEVSGSWDPTTRTLTLEDVEDTDDSGTYSAQLNPELSKMQGTLSLRHRGSVVQFSLLRKD